jgi:hypothetical protein
MIAYNKTLLENTFLVEEAIDLKKSGFIQESKLNTVKQKLETLKTSRNILVRIGFYILGSFLFSSILGFFSMFSLMNSSTNYHIVGFVYFIIGIIILEVICRQNYFRHGLDDSFIIGSQLTFYISIYFLTYSTIALYFSMIMIGFVFALRYVNTISFLVSLIGVVVLTGDYLINHTDISSALPFVLLLIAFGFYFLHQKIKDLKPLYFYQNVMEWFFSFSLLLGYASINYFVVRTLSEDLLHADYTKSDVPFGWIFNILMFLIPIFYVYYALQTKNRTMLYIGGLTFTLSIATFRYYHSIMPAELALILAGSLMFGAVYFIIQKIKTKATGITFIPDRTSNPAMLSTMEALIINSQDMNHAEATQQSDMPFGGGGFSGGGAGGEY